MASTHLVIEGELKWVIWVTSDSLLAKLVSEST